MAFALFTYFNEIKEVDIYGSNEKSASSKQIKKEVLEKVIIKMEERQKNFDELRVNKPVVGDPAI